MPVMITFKKKPVLAAPAEPPRRAKRPNAKREALIDLVSEIIASDPYDFNGHQWAARTQQWYAAKLGTSVATVRNYLVAPFVRDRKLIGNQTLTILRIGEPDTTSERHIANTMRLIFLDHMKFREERGWLNQSLEIDGAPKQKPNKTMKAYNGVSSREYGCLNGLAGALPAGEELKLFRFALTNWPLFMSAVDYKISEANMIAELDGKPHPYKKRFYNFPSITVMLKFHDCILEAYRVFNPPTLAQAS